MNSDEYEKMLRGYLLELMATGEVTIDGNQYAWVGGCLAPEGQTRAIIDNAQAVMTERMFKQEDVDACTLPESEGPGIHSLSDLLLDLYEHEQED